MQNALPQWHTHSTISGDQTGLGLAHEERQARIASNGKGRAANGDVTGHADGAAGTEQDGRTSYTDTFLGTAHISNSLLDLSAYYASLGAQPAATDIPVKAEIAPAPADDEDEEMEDVSAGLSKVAGPSVPTAIAPIADDKDDEDEFEETPVVAASANSTEETADGVDPNTMVMGTRYPSDILPVHVLIRLLHSERRSNALLPSAGQRRSSRSNDCRRIQRKG